MSAQFLVGDVFERMAEIPDGSIDLVLTSPPFLALRSYLPPDHPDKGKEIGNEPNPGAFLDTLLALTAEWRRVLAPHGSIAVELGDTYAGSGGGGGDYLPGGLREDQPAFGGSARAARYKGSGTDTRYNRGGEGPPTDRRQTFGGDWPLDKSLCGIPHLYHLCLAYGRNLLTGEPSPAGPWRVRNVVAWCRPNPPVGALSDKFRPGTSYMTIATMARDRYFDLDAVRGNPDAVKDQRHRTTNGPKQDADPSEVLTANYHQRVPSHPNGPPPLDWWAIPTQPFAGSHYATFPMALCERPIKAMVPQRVCLTCGEPSRRVTTEPVYIGTDSGEPIAPESWASFAGDTRHKRSGGMSAKNDGRKETATRTAETVGWTDCGHDNWRTGVVLDPFAGSGTTLAAATGHGRDAIGIDLDERNAWLAVDRVGPMFLTVDVSHIGAAS